MNLLFLCHRIPYPPNKGDKIRSFHWLRTLCARYEVHLATFVDDPSDLAHVDTVRSMCATANFVRLRPHLDQARALDALVLGEPITVRYLSRSSMRRWISRAAGRVGFDRVFVYSSGMAPYALAAELEGARRVLDLCDVDSAKWSQYAQDAGPAKRWIYAREARTLAARERDWCARFDASLVSSEIERSLLEDLVGNAPADIRVLGNGVDTDYFDPERDYPDPLPNLGPVVVFTGAMDYLANVDAVEWFVREAWPRVLERVPTATFGIVGSRPTPRVTALARMPGVVVTGSVPDVRPYLKRANCVVAPLRIARGVQNKVLEALAMNRPIVASLPAIQGIPGGDRVAGLQVATDPAEFAALVVGRLASPWVSGGGRDLMQRCFSWESASSSLLGILEDAA